MSNLLFTTRGSLQIADGSSYLGQYATEVNPAFPLVEWLTAYTNFNYADSPYIVAVSQAVSPALANVTNLTATPSGIVTIGNYSVAK